MFIKYFISIFALIVIPLPVFATQINIINMDGAGEGFNDTTPVVEVAGNQGTTIGEQRLIVFQFAARIWESIIDSSVEIDIEAKFDPLTCTSTSAILGSAGTKSLQRNFPNAPFSNTWYSTALANSISGIDLSSSAEISATFNSSVDNNSNCLGSYNWYYGLDGQKPSATVELLSVVMHEIAHGLGFQTFVDLNTGSKFGTPGRDDAYMLKLEDHSLNATWDTMSNNQRKLSISDTADLHWIGSNVSTKVNQFTNGINQGHVRMYAPSPVESGSSVSHFSNSLSPNELMEPKDTGPKVTVGLSKELFNDIGWALMVNAKPVISNINDVVYQPDQTNIAFVLRDEDDDFASLIVTAQSSNTNVISSQNINISGSGTARNVSFIPNGAGVSVITISVSDGFNSVETTFSFTVINTKPVLNITNPVNEINVSSGSAVLFEAEANDAEDGDISNNIEWLSSIDGVLGTGSFVMASLSDGVHTISAEITDSNGEALSKSVTINVLGDSDNDGMNDAWELNNFFTLDRDGTGDIDGNGISDLDEYLISITDANGDINADGYIDAADMLLILNHINEFSLLAPLMIARGDLYPQGQGDGIINTSDLILLKKTVDNTQ